MPGCSLWLRPRFTRRMIPISCQSSSYLDAMIQRQNDLPRGVHWTSRVARQIGKRGFAINSDNVMPCYGHVHDRLDRAPGKETKRRGFHRPKLPFTIGGEMSAVLRYALYYCTIHHSWQSRIILGREWGFQELRLPRPQSVLTLTVAWP